MCFINNILYKPNTPLFIFRSGSSYHGYLCELTNHEDWTKYLGKLLLLNKGKQKEIVDHSWVSHSLQMAFSTLRLSNTCNKLLPELFKVINYPRLSINGEPNNTSTIQTKKQQSAPFLSTSNKISSFL